MKKKLLMFDFDGTIADTLHLGYQIQRDFADDYNLAKVEEEEVKDLRELSSHEVLKRLGISFVKIPFLAVKFQMELAKRINLLEPIEGMIEVLKILDKMQLHLGIVTSNSKENVEKFLNNYSIRKIFSFIHSEKNIFGKARVLKKTMKEHAYKNEEVIYIGDETRDVESAKKAGIPIFAVGWGFNSSKILKKYNPDFIAESPRELLKKIEEIV